MKKFIVRSREFGVRVLLLSSLFLLPSFVHAAEMPESVKSKMKSFAAKQPIAEVSDPIEETTTAPIAMTKAVSVAPVANKSEAQTKLEAIKKQEQWIAKLTKQLEGEKNQLKEMREGYAQAFGKEPK